ncbi:MAG TPA: type II toxin-antitoxin system VapC family toxin [Candidatus Thiothrix moscowensis]|uniref:type II toxin-antitoxin system VapC family toxin n=1 Tax=unclassified Thiothrix TaxID=2636184 RepID=UPI0025CEECBC|nr:MULTISPECIES: type II toxin-antitoxin system VapC family toxin [unclassified Thiothrix]HRJ51563.1 type II toxin-antitoxin system VapC family toxin [Candidatus Thiothrix moscowensis]HRJ91878.1 type II toxin-antitoxin system VapC family toxin [Candidatus Thiothrix moscowensis]
MGLKYLLDANILSEPTKKQPNPNVLHKLDTHAGEYCTTVTVWHELNYGLARLADSQRKDGLAAYLQALECSGLPILPYEKPAGVWLALERARFARQGISVPFADGEIAAVAFTNQLLLVTRNVGDFSMYEQLAIENWFED